MGSVRLSTPALRVVLHEDDDAAVEVQTTNADLVLAERTARKHKWGTIQESPLTYQTFMSWAALRRHKLIDDTVTYEAFEGSCASIEIVDDDDDDDDGAGLPTGPGRVPGLSAK